MWETRDTFLRLSVSVSVSVRRGTDEWTNDSAMASLTSIASLTHLPPLRVKATATPFLSSLPIKGGSRRRRIGNGSCRAELSPDAPLAAAIGACVLSSLVLPASAGSGGGDDEEDDGAAVGSADARFAVMGIVSFIPYFNWLVKVCWFRAASAPCVFGRALVCFL